MSIDARDATAVAIADKVRAGTWLARDVVEHYLDRIARLDGTLGCLGVAVEVRAAVACVVDHDLHHVVAAQVLGQGVEVRQEVGPRR